MLPDILKDPVTTRFPRTSSFAFGAVFPIPTLPLVSILTNSVDAASVNLIG